jgi:hypothetical protein
MHRVVRRSKGLEHKQQVIEMDENVNSREYTGAGET